jgi:uncharacterized protein
MELRVLKSVIEEVLGSELIEKRITLVWHAGEPLTLPIAYYAAAFELVRELDTQGLIRHSITLTSEVNDLGSTSKRWKARIGSALLLVTRN